MSKFNVTEKQQGITVFKRDEEDIDTLIKRFKKKVNRSGILRELRVKSYYEKPSVQRKRKRNESKLRRLKNDLKIENIEKNKKRKDKITNDSGNK